jgi:hypothetical protein
MVGITETEEGKNSYAHDTTKEPSFKKHHPKGHQYEGNSPRSEETKQSMNNITGTKPIILNNS